MAKLILDEICTLFLAGTSSVSWVSFVGKQVVQEVIILWSSCLEGIESLSGWIWRGGITLSSWLETFGIHGWELHFLSISLGLLLCFCLVEFLSVFFSSLEPGLEQLCSDALFLSFLLSVLFHDFIMIVIGIFPIIFPLGQQGLLLFCPFLIDLLQMHFLFIWLFHERLFFLF